MTIWEKMVETGTLIVPIMAYSKYDSTGNYSEAHKLGVKFVRLHYHPDTTLPVFYVAVDDETSNLSDLADTPEELL